MNEAKVFSFFLKKLNLELKIIMEDLTLKGKFGIISLLFEASRKKKRSILLEPFAAAAVNL